MIPQLKRRLTLFYTCVTGCILTGIVVLVALIGFQSSRQRGDQLFLNQLMTICQKLQYDSAMSHEWLNDMERQNGLIISIEENGTPLLYHGMYATETPRKKLLERAKEAARRDQVETDVPPVSTSLTQSSLFTVKGDHGDQYSGTVLVFLARKSYFSIVLLKDKSLESTSLPGQIAIYVLADILGILCLLFANHRLVGIALAPVAENEKKQQAFLAAASHELRSPLTVIQASADAALSEPEKQPALLSTIRRECHRMSRLIGDMLLLTASKNSGWQLIRTQLDLDTLLLELYESFHPLCAEKGLRLRLELPDDPLPEFNGDGERLSQLLGILLNNALSHSGTKDELILTARTTKNLILISVIDHGIGIPWQEQAQIFESFYRSDHSRKDKQHFGLGLSVALELAKSHGGKISLQDTPGGGCTFSVELRRTDPRQ